jgi:hypothetical protein
VQDRDVDVALREQREGQAFRVEVAEKLRPGQNTVRDRRIAVIQVRPEHQLKLLLGTRPAVRVPQVIGVDHRAHHDLVRAGAVVRVRLAGLLRCRLRDPGDFSNV